jgi:DNA-binding NtrC family response regulator
MAERGEFRADLFYRLNAMTLEVPPLRDRTEEIGLLTQHFLELSSRNHHISLKQFDENALQVLKTYQWPGNIRELRNVIDRALVIAEGNAITIDDLPERLRRAPSQSTRIPTPPSALSPSPLSSPTLSSGPTVPPASGLSNVDFKARVREFEIGLMLEALNQARGKKTLAASILRMPIRTFMHKWNAYALGARASEAFKESEAATTPQSRFKPGNG